MHHKAEQKFETLCMGAPGALGSLAPHAAGLALLISSSRVETLRAALLRSCAQLLPSMTPAEAARYHMLVCPFTRSAWNNTV